MTHDTPDMVLDRNALENADYSYTVRGDPQGERGVILDAGHDTYRNMTDAEYHVHTALRSVFDPDVAPTIPDLEPILYVGAQNCVLLLDDVERDDEITPQEIVERIDDQLETIVRAFTEIAKQLNENIQTCLNEITEAFANSLVQNVKVTVLADDRDITSEDAYYDDDVRDANAAGEVTVEIGTFDGIIRTVDLIDVDIVVSDPHTGEVVESGRIIDSTFERLPDETVEARLLVEGTDDERDEREETA